MVNSILRMVLGSLDPVEECAATPNDNYYNSCLYNPALPTLFISGYTITLSLTVLSYVSEANLTIVHGLQGK